MNAIRSTLFMAYAIVWSVLSAPLVIIAGPLLGGKWAYRFGRLWRLGTQFGVENILGIRPKIIGRENMPTEACVILAKHQSAWETMTLQDCVPAIGDSLRDLQASAVLGCQPILVLTGKGEKTKAEGNLPDGTLEFADLAAAVDHLLGKAKK